MTLRHVFFGAAVAALSVVSAAQVLAQEADARLKQEAQALFRVVMADAPRPDACQFELEWDQAYLQVPEVQEFIGSVARDGSSTSDHATLKLKDILDPDGKWPDAFCAPIDAKMSDEAWVSSVKAGVESSPTMPSRHRLRSKYSFPIFDVNHRKAVVLAKHSQWNWQFKKDLSYWRAFDMVEIIHVYDKIDGQWRKTRDVPTAHATGG